MAPDLMTRRIVFDTDGSDVIFRIRETDRCKLEQLIFSRYPKREWGTFFRFGFRRTGWGLALSFVDLLPPQAGDMDRQSPLTVFRDEYSRRAFHAVSGPLALGVIHSHPEGALTWPSRLDDDMDSYFARELSAYGGGKPYCSLIWQRSDEHGLTFSGRVYDRGRWLSVRHLMTVGETLDRLDSELIDAPSSNPQSEDESATARLEEVLGKQSATRLRRTTVGVVGCSGTGSPAVHVLARAGVEDFVLVDPERLASSNLERLHGSYPDDLRGEKLPLKVELMRRMITKINPAARARCLAGNVLHENVIDELLRCDLVLGCVDSHHGRAALSDFARHFLLPALDVGVLMDGRGGHVSSQVVEITRYRPEDPCAFCRCRIDSTAMAFELMSDAEIAERSQQAEEARGRGDDPDAYWRGRPRQFHTVGYLTTAAGALVAGYAEGWLTGCFDVPHTTVQFDPSKAKLGVVAAPEAQTPGCMCTFHIGWGDAGRAYRSVGLPPHWSRRAVIVGVQ